MNFRDPEELLREVEDQIEETPSVELFNDPRHGKLREAWCAALFGVGYSKHHAPCRIAVNEGTERLDADFFLKLGEDVHDFQLTEVQEPGRRRGREYRRFADATVRTTTYSPERGRIEGPKWIADGIRAKARRNYAEAEQLNLLVYANFSAQALDCNSVHEAAAMFSGVFASVWILTSLYFCCLSPNAELPAQRGWLPIRPIEDYYVDGDA